MEPEKQELKEKWKDENNKGCPDSEIEASEIISEEHDFQNQGSPNFNLPKSNWSNVERGTIKSFWISDSPKSSTKYRLSILITTESGNVELVEFPIMNKDSWDYRIESFFSVINVSSDEIEKAIGSQLYIYEGHIMNCGDKYIMSNMSPLYKSMFNISGVFIMCVGAVMGLLFHYIGKYNLGLFMMLSLTVVGFIMSITPFVIDYLSEDIQSFKLPYYYGREPDEVIG